MSRSSAPTPSKIAHGGWLPLVIGGVLFTLMTTWKKGRQLVSQRLMSRAMPLEEFVSGVREQPPARVPGTAVFMTAQPNATPAALMHNVRFNKVLHQHVITLMVVTELVPYVPDDQRATIRPLGQGLSEVVLRYGFMENADVPRALLQAREQGLAIDAEDITYFLGRETLVVTSSPGMAIGASASSSSWRATPCARPASSSCRPNAWRNSACRWKSSGCSAKQLRSSCAPSGAPVSPA